MPDLQIKPLEGIGEVNFGMPVGVVRHILGEPEKSVIDIQEDRGNLTSNRLIYSRKWAYPSLGIVLPCRLTRTTCPSTSGWESTMSARNSTKMRRPITPKWCGSSPTIQCHI